MIVEIGGTVGDIESLPFLEAIRQMRQELGRENTLFVHVTLVPFIAAASELKTSRPSTRVKELLGDRNSAGHSALPHRPLPAEGTEIENRALLQRGRRGGDYRERCRVDLRSAR